jgi:phosphoglycolate phosphatase
MRECDLRAGTRETLALGRARGLTQSILSAMKQDMLHDLIDHFDLADYFNDVVGLSDHHAFGKIELAQSWLAAQALEPGAILFVGDTTHDYEVAQALGAACVYIHSGHHSRERLAALGEQPIETLADVHRLIDASGAHLE